MSLNAAGTKGKAGRDTANFLAYANGKEPTDKTLTLHCYNEKCNKK